RISNPLIRIAEGHAEALDLRTERRTIHHIVVSLDEGGLVEHSETAANDGLGAPAKVIRKSDSRGQIGRRGLAPSFRASRITGKQVAGGRFGKPLRRQSGNETLGAPEFVRVRIERIPTHAEVEHQPASYAYAVLSEEAAQVSTPRGIFPAALHEALHGPQQEVRPGVAAVRAPTEAEAPRLAIRIIQVHLHTQEIASEGNVMRSADPV